MIMMCVLVYACVFVRASVHACIHRFATAHIHELMHSLRAPLSFLTVFPLKLLITLTTHEIHLPQTCHLSHPYLGLRTDSVATLAPHPSSTTLLEKVDGAGASQSRLVL